MKNYIEVNVFRERKNELPIVIKHIAIQTEIAGDLRDWANEIGIE
jgi:uncharacterized OsmC-like protein